MNGHRELARQLHRTPVSSNTIFSPYWLLDAAPWLVLSLSFRTYAVAEGAGAAILYYMLALVLLFVAFLKAAQRLISTLGGASHLGTLDLRDQIGLGWSLVWRLILVSLGVYYVAMALGLGVSMASRMMHGLDGIVFLKHIDAAVIWNALMATIAYLMILARGLGRKPGLLDASRQFVSHWRYLVSASVAIAVLVCGINVADEWLRPILLGELHAQAPLAIIILYFLPFTYARFWIAVTVITLALRASYRNS